MCGIAGVLSRRLSELQWQGHLQEMTGCIQHRGPDDRGHWWDAEAGIGLGHRRLAILDLSPEGSQPMHSASGRYTIAFNGEVYNFQALRRELQRHGYAFRGGSDTEVILAAFEEWGVQSAVSRFVGMFAISVWDRECRKLHLVRDRMGVKPLYYGSVKGDFVFASELTSVYNAYRYDLEVDADAVALMFRQGYIPAPYTIYRGLHKLEPGKMIEVELGQDGIVMREEVYWSLESIAESGRAQPFSGSEREAERHLEDLISDAVLLRTIADVPLGSFLSGGVDSSLVTAIMQVQSQRPVQTFSIGFEDSLYDEAIYAKEVALHLGTDHTDLYVKEEDLLHVVPMLATMYDEPFGDSSQIPTYLVSRLARQHVTVSLSGDGGDELFGGYRAYSHADRLRNFLNGWPSALRKQMVAWSSSWASADWVQSITRQSKGISRKIDRLAKMGPMARAGSGIEMYKALQSFWTDASLFVNGSNELSTVYDRDLSGVGGDFVSQMMFMDTKMYMPDDILCKVDRASMAVSLEVRVPLLDHSIVEFAWSLPSHIRVSKDNPKRLLKSILFQHVPESLIERPKKGFSVPLDRWLRGPLRDWAEELMDPSRMSLAGYLNVPLVQNAWRMYIDHKRGSERAMWNVLMFQAWLEARQFTSPAESSVETR